MANQVADSLSIINSIYYAAVHPTQLRAAWSRAVFAAYGKDTLTGWFQMNSKRVSKPAMTFLHQENDRLQLPITSATTVSGAAGAAVTVTFGPTSSYINAGAYFPLQAGYKITDGVNWYTVGTITQTAFAWTAPVTPDVATVALSFTAAQQLFSGRQVAVLEGSTKTLNSLRGDGVTFTNYLQEFRRDAEFTGQSMAQFSKDVTFFDYNDPYTNEPAQYWRQAEVDRVMLEKQNATEVYCILGQAATNPLVSAVYGLGTTGVIPAIKAWGNTKNYSKAAGWQIADFEDMTIVMEKNNSINEYLMWNGIELNNDAEMSIKDFFPNGSMTFGSFGAGGQKEAAGFGFNSFAAFGRTFHMHRMEIFNRPDFLGAAFGVNGADYIGSSIVLPAGKVQGVGGADQQYIQMCYLEGNGNEYGPDHWVVDGMGWFGGGNVNRPTDKRSTIFCFADCYGVEVNAAKQLFYVQRTN